MNISRRTLLKALAGSALTLGVGHRVRGQRPPLRLSLPPLQDVLPLGFAEAQGLFKAAGLPVEFVGISSQRERSSALLSNNLDGLLGDISTLLFNRGNAEADVVITSTAFETIDGTRALALLASGFFNVPDLDTLIKRIDDRPQNSITLGRRSDMELVADDLMASVGVTVDPEVFYADADDLVTSATLLVGGSVLASVLPEPLAALTEQNELIDPQFLSKSVSNFESVALLPSIITFRREVVEQRQDDVALFYEVYREAINIVNTASQDVARESAILTTLELFLPGLSRSQLPQNFGQVYTIPRFPLPRALTADEFSRVSQWALDKQYLFSDVAFDAAVDFRFLSP